MSSNLNPDWNHWVKGYRPVQKMYARKYIPISSHADPSYTITAEQAANLKASIDASAQAFDKHIDKVEEYLTFRAMHYMGVISR